MGSAYSEKDAEPEYWFNLKTLKVEVGKKSPAPNRVGPFASRSEAETALEMIAKRNKDWQAEESDR